jgi:hypothetical protein
MQASNLQYIYVNSGGEQCGLWMKAAGFPPAGTPFLKFLHRVPFKFGFGYWVRLAECPSLFVF